MSSPILLFATAACFAAALLTIPMPARAAEPPEAASAESSPDDDAALAQLLRQQEETRPKRFEDDDYKLPSNPTAADADRLTREVTRDMCLNGVPLSPAILDEFQAPAQGLAPVALEINLLRLARNRYSGAFTAMPVPAPGVARDTFAMVHDKKCLRYQKLGRLHSGAWVVRRESFDSESGRLPGAILLLRVSVGTIPVTETTEKRMSVSGTEPAVLLRCVGFLKLADRDRRCAKLEGDTLTLTDSLLPDTKPLRVDLSATP